MKAGRKKKQSPTSSRQNCFALESHPEALVEEHATELMEANQRLRQEIEDRKLIERNLRESEERHRLIFESSRDAIFISDSDGRFLDINQAGSNLTGYPREELMQMTIQDFNQNLRGDSYQVFFERLLQGEALSGDAMLKRKNGEMVSIEYSCAKIVIGNLPFVYTVARDITARKLSEEKLRRSEALYRELVQSANSIILRFNTQGRITFINEYAQRFFGFSERQIIGRHVMDTIVPHVDSSGHNLHYKFKKLLRNPEKYHSFEIENVRSNGERVWIAWTNRVVLDKDGNIAELLAVGIDNTERMAYKEHIHHLTYQLIKAQESERLHISRDLHDNIAQDLSSLKIGLETLFDDQPAMREAARERIERLTLDLRRSISVVRDMAYGLRPPGLDQLGLVRTIFLYCEDFSASNNIHTDFNAAGMDDLLLDFDTEINIYRLIQEALRNIQRHSEAKNVTIRLVASSPNIVLRIKDNGKGFDLKNRRLQVMQEKRMGLQSMEERVGLLGGEIRIDSRPNRGTTIFIEIPLKEKQLEE
jgi:PAS domain S-box-containing protein